METAVNLCEWDPIYTTAPDLQKNRITKLYSLQYQQLLKNISPHSMHSKMFIESILYSLYDFIRLAATTMQSCSCCATLQASVRFWPKIVLRSSCSWSSCSWSMNNLGKYSKFNMLQEHYLNAHCSRSIFRHAPGALCILIMLLEYICYMLLEHWSIVHSNMLLEHIWLRILLQIIHAPGA